MSNFYLIVKRCASCAVLALGFPSLLSAGEPGTLTREIWNDLPGTTLSAFTRSPRYGQPADSVTTFAGAAVPQNIGDSFASRVRGYLTAPVTGDYTFWIASDDESELRLSPTDSKFGRAKIASISGWVQPFDWDAKSSPKIRANPLVSGPTLFHRGSVKRRRWRRSPCHRLADSCGQPRTHSGVCLGILYHRHLRPRS